LPRRNRHEVPGPSCMLGAGFKKCMPMTRPVKFEVEAIRVTEIDEVLVARIVSGRQTPSKFSIPPS
jgi:hypothetical protein